MAQALAAARASHGAGQPPPANAVAKRDEDQFPSRQADWRGAGSLVHLHRLGVTQQVQAGISRGLGECGLACVSSHRPANRPLLSAALLETLGRRGASLASHPAERTTLPHLRHAERMCCLCRGHLRAGLLVQAGDVLRVGARRGARRIPR